MALNALGTSPMKIMMVTGGGRGIGAAIVAKAARQGFAVCVNYNQSQAAAEQLVKTVVSTGAQAIAVQADVSRPDGARHLFSETRRLLGEPDVLVNNAGIIAGRFPIDQMDDAALVKVFEANVYSTFYCCREAVTTMSTARGGAGGVIVNVSSAAARHGGLAHETHYAASKGAVDSFTIGLAKEVGKQGIRVNALRP